MAVTAMDPEPEMLAATQLAAKAVGVHVTLKQASSYDLSAEMGPFRLAAIGRAFHWMDRAATPGHARPYRHIRRWRGAVS